MSDNNKNQALTNFLANLFDEGNSIWVRTRIAGIYYSTSLATAKSMVGSSREGTLVSIHPARGWGLRRSSRHVAPELRTFLVEWDEKDIPLSSQSSLQKRFGFPFSSSVFSGGGSIHFLICLENTVPHEEYILLWRMLALRLPSIDRACSNLSVATRMPFCERLEKGKRQELLELRQRIPNAEFLDWLGYKELKEKLHLMNTRETAPRVTGDRAKIIERLLEYLKAQGCAYDGIRGYFPCPICQDEGKDTQGDNLGIQGEQMLFTCHADKTHNKEIVKFLLTPPHK